MTAGVATAPLTGAATQLGSVVVCHRELLIAAATAALLEQWGVARTATTAGSLSQVLAHLRHGADLAVVFDGVDEDVAELFEAIRLGGLPAPVLLVCDADQADRLAQVLEWGAAGVLPTSSPPQVLCRAVADARHGRLIVPSDIRPRVREALIRRRARRHAAAQRLAQLTRTEERVLRGLAAGQTVTQIARQMSMSPHTIRSQVRTVGDKLGVRGQLRVAARGRDLLGAAERPRWALADTAREPAGA